MAWLGASARSGSVSLPVWEEWIEMLAAEDVLPSSGSLPVWEEWIEMSMRYTYSAVTPKSLPVWEEWIEMAR